MRMRVAVITNQKGGVGKTATTRFVASILNNTFKKKVLVIDLDAQAGNLSRQVGVEDSPFNTRSVLLKQASLADAIQHTQSFDICPAFPDLVGTDKEISTDADGNFRLDDAIKDAHLEDVYDFILIDTPPALSNIIYNALIAATDIIMPVTPDIDAVSGLLSLSETIQVIQHRSNPNLRLTGILMTMFERREENARTIEQVAEIAAGKLNTSLFKTHIRKRVAVSKSKTSCDDLVLKDPHHPIVEDYTEFVREFLGKE